MLPAAVAPGEAEAAPPCLATSAAVRVAVLATGVRTPRLGVAVGVAPRAGEEVGGVARATPRPGPPGVPTPRGAPRAAGRQEGRAPVVAAPRAVLGAGVGRPGRRVGAVVAAVAPPRLLQGPRWRVAPETVAEEGVGRGPPAGDAVVVVPPTADAVSGDTESAVEGA